MRVAIAPVAARGFERLPTLVKVRVLRIFARLGAWPHTSGARPLGGPSKGRYRMRTGDYRVQFRVEATCIVVERVGHRDGFYDK